MSPRKTRRRWPGRLIRLLSFVFFVALVALLAGFGIFTASIATARPDNTGKADGIVVLTGGAERLSEAFDLLAQGNAQRLLITGVNVETTDREIVRLHPGSERWLACCVDLDRRAMNTIGNAVETREWVSERGFRRVIVVTSSWHMPRTMMELGRALPEVELIPYPVVAGRDGSPGDWPDLASLRLLVTEYAKYLAALVEIRIVQRPDMPQLPPRETAHSPG